GARHRDLRSAPGKVAQHGLARGLGKVARCSRFSTGVPTSNPFVHRSCTPVQKSNAHPICSQSFAHSLQKHRGVIKERSAKSSSLTFNWRPLVAWPWSVSDNTQSSGRVFCIETVGEFLADV